MSLWASALTDRAQGFTPMLGERLRVPEGLRSQFTARLQQGAEVDDRGAERPLNLVERRGDHVLGADDDGVELLGSQGASRSQLLAAGVGDSTHRNAGQERGNDGSSRGGANGLRSLDLHVETPVPGFCTLPAL